MEMKQNQTFFHRAYSNLTPYLFFYQKNMKVFQWLSKSKFLSFMTKANPNNENETKSKSFLWNILKFDIKSFLLKKYSGISITFIIKTSQFYDFSEPKQWKWIKIRCFSMGHIQIWHHIFFIKKLLKYLNDFQNQNFSVLWLQWTRIREMKQN